MNGDAVLRAGGWQGVVSLDSWSDVTWRIMFSLGHQIVRSALIRVYSETS